MNLHSGAELRESEYYRQGNLKTRLLDRVLKYAFIHPYQQGWARASLTVMVYSIALRLQVAMQRVSLRRDQ